MNILKLLADDVSGDVYHKDKQIADISTNTPQAIHQSSDAKYQTPLTGQSKQQIYCGTKEVKLDKYSTLPAKAQHKKSNNGIHIEGTNSYTKIYIYIYIYITRSSPYF